MAGSGSWALSDTKNRDNSKKYVVSWTASASDGSVPAIVSSSDIFGFVVLVVTNPGATAPTDDYDITITDEDSCDILGGEGADRDTANSEQIVPAIGSTYGPRYVSGKLTLNITNNSVNSAVGEVIVYVEV